MNDFSLVLVQKLFGIFGLHPHSGRAESENYILPIFGTAFSRIVVVIGSGKFYFAYSCLLTIKKKLFYIFSVCH